MEKVTKLYIVRKEGETDTPFMIYHNAVEYAEVFGGEVIKVVTTVKEYYELDREAGLWTTIKPERPV